MFHDFVKWIQEDLGRFTPDGQSWSQQLHESLFMWNVIEGTHVLTIMFFAGTIWIVDLRMMGVAFTNMPFSKLNDRVLPITVISFAAMVITGILTFIGRDPLLYYHNIWFRIKMLFLLVAVINIFWFHYTVQKSQAEWDALGGPPEKTAWSKAALPLAGVGLALLLMVGAVLVNPTFDAWLVIRLLVALVVTVAALIWYLNARNPNPPLKVKLSGAISMSSWFVIIIMGRLIAYDLFNCEKVDPKSLMYVLEECAQKLEYLNEAPPDDAGAATDAAPADEAAPAEPAPATPAPGQGG